MRAAYHSLPILVLAAGLAAGEARLPTVQPPMPRLGRPEQQVAKPDLGKGPGKVANPGGKPAKDDQTAAADDGGKSEPNTTAPAGDAIDHDSIILINEQRFQGAVLSDQPDPELVAINTGSGIMRIRRALVARVEYGLVTRMGRIQADDLAGLVDLAHWCRMNRRNAEALHLLTKAVALPGCDIQTRGFYAQLVDEIDGPEKALPLYIAYRNAGGSDPDILARLDVLEKAHQTWEDQMRASGLDPGASADAGKPVAAATASNVEEGLEKYAWVGDDPKWANPVASSQITLATPDGPRKVLEIEYLPNPADPKVDKAAIVLRRPLTLRPGTKLTLLAANRSTKDLRIGIAVKTGTDWTYYESQMIPLPATSSGQEFVQLTFDLAAPTFKAAASNWAHSAKVGGLDQVRELQILINNRRDKGSLWLAGIAFTGGE